MLTDNELEKLRTTFTECILRETATLLKRDRGSDAYGSPTQSFTTVGSVPCRVYSVGNRSRFNAELVGDRETLVDHVHISLPHGTEIDADMRIRVGSITYDVVTVEDFVTDAFVVTVLAVRVRGS